MIRNFIVIAMILVLSACSSTSSISLPGVSSPPEVEFSELYMRGVFNWWEATPAYQFQSSSSGWYVDIELIADGQPYDFKISDGRWTPAQTCGAKYQGQIIVPKEVVYGICGADAQNFQFTPAHTGMYRFTIAPASGGEVSLFVTRKE